jgi:pyrroline-5-carboxylate reductase
VVTENNTDVLRFADVIVIATKPDIIKPCLTQLVKKFNPKDFESKSFISIAAGVPISSLESYLPIQTKSMIRVMPNTPCLVGQSATVFSPGTKTTEEDKEICATLFRSVGTVTEVPEKNMDAATGLSGSGPACEPSSLPALTHSSL